MTTGKTTSTQTIGSLFAGIGGIDLGFERAGFTTVWQVEKNADCRRILRTNFPHANRKVTDVRYGGGRNLQRVDVIAGGFPCQDLSIANVGWGEARGLDGERSGLFFHMARIIRELRPRAVVMENVSALLNRGLGRVLGTLAEGGYDAEWECIPACSVGADHQRDRIWIVAYPRETRWAGCFFGQGVLEPAAAAFSEFSHNAIGRWSELPAAIQRLPNSDGLSVGMVRRLVSPYGNSVIPQIPYAIALRLKELLSTD